MIRIDLLPAEFRRAERTAPALFIATMGLAIFCSLCAVGAGWAWFGLVDRARSDVASAQDLFDGKKPQADYSDRLEAEKKEYTSRLDHIKTFGESRILWTKKLDQLASIIDSPAEQNRHMTWLDELQVDMSSAARGAGCDIKGNSSSAELKKLSDFHSDLAKGEFFKEFESISDPAGEVDTDDDYDPKQAWKFDFKLGLKNSGKDEKTKLKGPPGAKPAAVQPAAGK